MTDKQPPDPTVKAVSKSLKGMQAEIDRLRAENDKLKHILAKSSLPCIYCGLSALLTDTCPLGFPGCERAEDLVTGGD